MALARWRWAAAVGALLAGAPAWAQVQPSPTILPPPDKTPAAVLLPPPQELPGQVPAGPRGYLDPPHPPDGPDVVEGAPAPVAPTVPHGPHGGGRGSWRHGHWLGYPEEFQALPLGATVYAHYRTHVANGDAARMVLYNYDFVPGHAELNLRGKDELARIAAMLSHNPFPIVVERTPCDPALGQARALAVLRELGQCGIPISPERVVVGRPIAYGLDGVEAALIYQNRLIQIQTQGVTGGLGIGSIGGTVGQGFGAPGRTATPTTPGSLP